MSWAPHAFSLRQLQYLLAVAETRSFRRAAELCHVSQPSLSSQIAQIEAGLGAQVFERDRRRVLVTPTGQEILRRAKEVLVAADDLVDAALRGANPLEGRLRIGVIPTVAPYLLPDAAPALRRKFPQLTILWTEDKTASLVAGLRSGALDAALVALESELGDVESEVVARDAFVLAAPPTHPLGRPSRPVRQEELKGVDLLLLAEGHCLRDQALAACGQARGTSFAATSLPTLVQVVAGGAGVTLLPQVALRVENRRGELRIRRFAAPAPGRTLALVWRRRSPLADGLRAVARAIKECRPGR
jgi:LysR family hydrogen peroxide-inducible transcriptional activator